MWRAPVIMGCSGIASPPWWGAPGAPEPPRFAPWQSRDAWRAVQCPPSIIRPRHATTIARPDPDGIRLFKRAGGQTVVDPTNRSLGRDPLALVRIARATGLNVVMGAGYYVDGAHPPDMDRRTVDVLAREIIADVMGGVGDTGVRAGLIGEIGCTWPWTDNEKKVVRAAVAAQRETGAPLMIHPGRNSGAPMAIAEYVRKEGGYLRRTIMCHIDRTIAEVGAVFLDLARTGMWL